jgi:hypothetical protein
MSTYISKEYVASIFRVENDSSSLMMQAPRSSESSVTSIRLHGVTFQNTVFFVFTSATRESQNSHIKLTAMEMFYGNMNEPRRTQFVRSKYIEQLTSENNMLEHPVVVILGRNLSLIFTGLVYRSQGRHVVRF